MTSATSQRRFKHWQLLLACLTIVSASALAVFAEGSGWLMVAMSAVALFGLGLALYAVRGLARIADGREGQPATKRAYFLMATALWLLFVSAVPIGAWTGMQWVVPAGFLGIVALLVAAAIIEAASSRARPTRPPEAGG